MLTDKERGYVRYMLAKKIARKHSYRGRWLTVKEIAASTGYSVRTIERRLAAGLDFDLPTRRPGPAPRKYDFMGMVLTVEEIVRWTGWSKSTVRCHISGTRVLVGDDMTMTRLLQDNAVLLTFKGRTDTIAGWSQRLEITDATLRNRINRGWDIERALTEAPMRPGQRFVFKHNRRIIHTIAASFHPRTCTAQPTGGYQTTFSAHTGTGVGRQVADLHGKEIL